MTKRLCILIALLTCYVGMRAEDERAPRWQVCATAGFNSHGWEWGLGMAHTPSNYFGLRMTVGFAGEIRTIEDIIDDDDYWEDVNYYADRFVFTTSVMLKSPTIINWRSQDATFHIFCMPGLVLSPGAKGSRNAQWLCWDAKGGIEMDIDNMVFQLGYGCSNFNLYSGYPDSFRGYGDTTGLTHSVFLGIAYRF